MGEGGEGRGGLSAHLAKCRARPRDHDLLAGLSLLRACASDLTTCCEFVEPRSHEGQGSGDGGGGGTKHKTERKEEGDGRRKGREGEKRSEVGE